MAIGRLSVKIGKTGKAKPHAEYISRIGKYENKPEKGEKLIETNAGNMPSWAAADPLNFWKAADKFERKNGSTYREMEISLPRELSPDQNIDLIQDWIHQEIGNKHAYQWAYHEPKASDGKTNPHIHLMFSDRTIDGIDRPADKYFKRYNPKNPAKGGAKKSNTTKDFKTRVNELKELRHRWQIMCNAHLEKLRHDERIDMRSHKDRKTGLTPEPKQGPNYWYGRHGKDAIIDFREARERILKQRQEKENQEKKKILNRHRKVQYDYDPALTYHQNQELKIRDACRTIEELREKTKDQDIFITDDELEREYKKELKRQEKEARQKKKGSGFGR